MPRTNQAKNLEALRITEDFYASLKGAMTQVDDRGNPPNFPDIVTFAEHEWFCGKKLFPRQRTLLRLFYLDIEHMTDYDLEVIDEWRNGFYYGEDRIGVPPDIWDRVKWLRDRNHPHFREIEFIGGRRGGKGHLGGLVGRTRRTSSSNLVTRNGTMAST